MAQLSNVFDLPNGVKTISVGSSIPPKHADPSQLAISNGCNDFAVNSSVLASKTHCFAHGKNCHNHMKINNLRLNWISVVKSADEVIRVVWEIIAGYYEVPVIRIAQFRTNY